MPPSETKKEILEAVIMCAYDAIYHIPSFSNHEGYAMDVIDADLFIQALKKELE